MDFFAESNPVTRISALLGKQDSAWIKVLSDMTTEEILDVRDGEETVLSALIGAIFSTTERSDSVVANVCGTIYENLCKGKEVFKNRYCESGFIKLIRRVAEYVQVPGSQRQSEAVRDEITNTRSTIERIAEGLSIIAGKVEKTASHLHYCNDQTGYEEFCVKVEGFLQLENVGYEFAHGDERIAHRRSAVYALVLQYFFYTSDPEKQELLLKPIEKFFLGFSKYEIDKRGARPLHYALSMCGGICEENFVGTVLEPLVKEERSSRIATEEGVFPSDKQGNTLLHYALSSAYCSAKALRVLVANFGDAILSVPEGSHSLTKMISANIPYYALFFSRDFKRISNVNMSLGTNSACSSLGGGGMWKVKKTVGELAYELRRNVIAIRSMSNSYDNILKVICGIDKEICDFQSFCRPEKMSGAACILELLHDYRTCMDKICLDSHVDSHVKDKIVKEHIENIFDISNKSTQCVIGSREAVYEVVRALLHDPKFVRKINITAAYSREERAKSCHKTYTSGKDPESISDGWIYCPNSVKVSRFFSVMCDISKRSAAFFEGHHKLSKCTQDVLEQCHRDDKIFAISGHVSSALCAGMIIIAASVVFSTDLRIYTKVMVIFVVSSISSAAALAANMYCRYERDRTKDTILMLKKNFAKYMSDVGKEVSILQCENPYLNAIEGSSTRYTGLRSALRELQDSARSSARIVNSGTAHSESFVADPSR